jgi:NADH-quinone oxidoreductase subunit N
MALSIPDVNLASLLPEILLLAAATAALFLSGKDGHRRAASWAAAAVVASLLTTPVLFRGADVAGFDGLIVKDGGTLLFLALMDLAALVSILLSRDGDVGRRRGGEFFGLALFALIGMHIMAAGRDLLVVFRASRSWPCRSTSSWADRMARDGMEGAVKYFLLGSFSSALFLLGLAFYYVRRGPRRSERPPGRFHRRPCFSRGWP